MARANWEYVRVDVQMPEHPKIEILSDKAFRALVTFWCYSGRQRTDGIVTAKQWTAWPSKVRAELVTAGLVHLLEIGGDVVLHDYEEHQRTRAEIDELSRKRAEAGRKGGRVGKQALPNSKQVLKQTGKQVLSKCVRFANARNKQRQRQNKPCCGTGRVQPQVFLLRNFMFVNINCFYAHES